MATKKQTAALPNDGYRRFEYSDGRRSNKYWEIKTAPAGIPVEVRYGRIGKTFIERLVNGSASALIRSKVRKGYVEVTFT